MFNKSIILFSLGLCSQVYAVQTIEFSNPDYIDAALDEQQDWNTESGWSVNDSAGSGIATTSTINEIAILDDAVTLSSGDSYSFTVNFQFQGAFTPAAGTTYLFQAGLSNVGTASTHIGNADGINIQAFGPDASTYKCRLLNAFSTIGAALTGFGEEDELEFEYTITLGADAGSSQIDVELRNLTDATTSGVAIVSGINADLYSALTGAGAFPYFQSSNFVGNSSGLTALQVNSVTIPAAAVVIDSDIDFVAAEGFSDGALDGQQSWNAESGWSVSDSVDSGNATTSATNEIAILDDSVILGNGESYSFTVNFKYLGTFTPTDGFTYLFQSGLTSSNAAASHIALGSGINIQTFGSDTSTYDYRLLDASFAPLGTKLADFTENDELEFEYTITLGSNSASSQIDVELRNLTDAATSGVATIFGIDAGLYSALTGAGAFPYFQSNAFTGNSSGLTALQVNSVTLPSSTVIDNASSIDFVTPEGYSDGALDGQQNWNAASGWSVNDSVGSGNVSTSATQEIAILDDAVTLSQGDAFSMTVNFQFQGTFTPAAGASYLFQGGLTSSSDASVHLTLADGINLQVFGPDDSTFNYRLLDPSFAQLGVLLSGFAEDDVLEFEYIITLGADAASSQIEVELRNLTDATTSGLVAISGIDAGLYSALTGAGAFPCFQSNAFSDNGSGLTALQVNTVTLGYLDPAPVIPPTTANTDITNGSAEIVTTAVDGDYLNDGDVIGWGGNATLHQGDNDYGNGAWAISLENSQVAMQQTGLVIETGAAYSLRFDAALFGSSASAQLFTAEFFTVDGGVATAIGTRIFTLSAASSDNWAHYQFIVSAGALDANAGDLLGVQFLGLSLSKGASILIDNVRLEATPASTPSGAFSYTWDSTPDQAWAGPGFWANRTQDWEISSGRLQCINNSLNNRTLHRTGTTIRGNGEDFTLRVRTGLNTGTSASGSRSGFLLGAGPNLDWRAQLLVHAGTGRDFGTFFGVNGQGQAIIEDLNSSSANVLDSDSSPGTLPADTRLELNAVYNSGDQTYTLTLNAYDDNYVNLVSSSSTTLSSERLCGGFGLLNNRGSNASYWYDDFSGTGNALKSEPDRALTIIGSMYTLSEQVLNLTAQLSPVSVASDPTITLETFNGATWDLIDTVSIDNTDGLSSYTAKFQVANWDDSEAIPYRIGVTLPTSLDGSGASTIFYREGTIQQNPVDKNPLVIASTTCQRTQEGNVQASGNDWTPSNIWHPHDQLWRNIAKQQPDVLLALGDQIYEWTSPTPEDNSSDYNRQHDYLYKWFFWVLQSHEVTKDVPTIAIPDDHDIFQGNFWGEGGNANPGDEDEGGYQSPGSWLRMVERTQTSNLPDPDPYNPIQPAPTTGDLNLNVYFTGVKYGGVGFAVLEDRKFKTGPNNLSATNPEDQHLLGERQHAFLKEWATDWDDQKIKLTISQTPFGSVTTHGSTNYGYFGVNSTDSAGWPEHRRDEAWEHLRLSRMFQLAGDLHVGSVVHHGIDSQGDAGFSFTAPAVGNFFPRIWDPAHTSSGINPQNPETYDSYLGDFYNQNGINYPHYRRFYAASNSYEFYGETRGIDPATYHDRGIGYGVILIDKQSRLITFECWPTHADPEYPSTGGQYKDWPITIKQTDNDGRTPAGFLPLVNSGSETDPVVSVYDESTGALVYSQRILGNSFRPPVYDLGTTYLIEVSYGDNTTSDVTLTGQFGAAEAASTISKFIALQPSIESGSSTLLHWDVASASSLTIDNGVGDVEAYTVDGIGHVAVSPSSDTTYTLTLNGGITEQTTVLVFPAKTAWLDIHFDVSEQGNPLISGDAADADGDGFSNYEEFRFQTDPRSASDFPVMGSVIETASGTVTIEFAVPFPIGSSIYVPIVEASSNLSDWDPLPANSYTETIRETTSQGTTRLTLQLTDTVGVERKFYRAAW
ncbi:MAG: alkaline phosphatase D family protein [Opitutaceae bacterium]